MAQKLKHWLTILTVAAATVLFSGVPALAQQAGGPDYDQDTIEALYGNWPQYVPDYGCDPGAGGGTPANLTVGKDFSLGELNNPELRQVNLMKALIADYGFTPAQAAGIVGNFMEESGGTNLPPDVNEGGIKGPPRFVGGYGWAQWTGDRQRAFIEYVVANGYIGSGAPANDAANYAWLKFELSDGYKPTVAELLRMSSARDAALSFHRTFEKSADTPAMAQERADAAEKALAAFNGTGGGGTSAPGGGGLPSGGCAGGGGATLAECGTVQQCAQMVIDHPGIELANKVPAQMAQAAATGSVGGVAVSAKLLQVLLSIANAGIPVKLSSYVRPEETSSFHSQGRAADLFNIADADLIMRFVFDNRVALGIDELIWANPPAGTSTLDQGQPHTYNAATINGHRDHVHIAVSE